MARVVREALRSTFSHIYTDDAVEAELSEAPPAEGGDVEAFSTTDPWLPRLVAIDSQARRNTFFFSFRAVVAVVVSFMSSSKCRWRSNDD